MSSNSALTANYFFGWDLLYSTIEAKVDQKSDVLIALAHFVLIKHSHFQCIGVGEDKTLSEDEAGSEMLPVGWNDNEKKYALRYLNNNKLYLLLGHKSEDCLIINLLDVDTKKVSNIALEPEDLVKQLKGPISKMVPSASQLVDRFGKELVEPVFQGNTRECTTQTTITPEGADPMRVDPLRIGDPMRPGPYMPRGTYPRNFGFPEVGRGDLDPLGRGGPGNLMPFPSRPNFGGGGSFPRFDPFGPPEPNIRPNPNPDHLPPPNFGGDDYYM